MQDVYTTSLPRMQSQLSFPLMESSTRKDFKLAIQCLQLLLLQVCVYVMYCLHAKKAPLSLFMVDN